MVTRDDGGRWRPQPQGPTLGTLGRPPWEDVAGAPLVARRPFRLFGVDYAPGEAVPRDAAADRVLRNLYNARRLDAAESPPPALAAEIAGVPEPTQDAGRRRRRREPDAEPPPEPRPQPPSEPWPLPGVTR